MNHRVVREKLESQRNKGQHNEGSEIKLEGGGSGSGGGVKKMGEGGGGVRKNKWETVEKKHKEKSADVCVLQEQAG